MQRINYKAFIEDNFSIKTRKGEIIPFIFNTFQNAYYYLLINDYPTMENLRENVLKARQQGASSLIDAIITTDFILSALGDIPVIGSQIISHKAQEVKPLFSRIDLYIDSFLHKNKIQRKRFLKFDNHSTYMEAHSGAEIFVGTAGAKTLGRGGTLQNIHWSEPAFYPNTPVLNAKDLVTGAEQQVGEGIGKIFRESTGNTPRDFFGQEYARGKECLGDFKSRFFPWYLEKSYTRAIPNDPQERAKVFTPEYEAKMQKYKITPEQIYWYIKKIESRMSKHGQEEETRDVLTIKREYPFDDTDAFLMSGDCYFDRNALKFYKNEVREPITEGVLII